MLKWLPVSLGPPTSFYLAQGSNNRGSQRAGTHSSLHPTVQGTPSQGQVRELGGWSSATELHRPEPRTPTATATAPPLGPTPMAPTQSPQQWHGVTSALAFV